MASFQAEEEEDNHVRMSMMLTGLSPRAVRALFDREFPPTSLPSKLNQKYNTLLSLQKSRVINQAQWNLLFPSSSGIADSKTFDVTLMICLIRNLTLIAPPVLGFDRLPSAGETTPGADLARIKYYRNYLAHIDDNKIDNSYFTTSWNDISNAVRRLGGPAMYQECQDIKYKILERSTIPWNIREQMTNKLENWKEDDQMFVETHAASLVLQCIKTNSCVTVIASSGVGKTFTVRHVSLQMADDGYDILNVTNPEDIVKYYNPNKKTLYVIDDLCGTYTLNQTYLDKWKATHGDLKELLKNDATKIIASCRLQVYQDEQFKLLPIFKACACNLSQDMSLSKEEKQLIAEKYLKSDAYKISQYIDLFDFFPLLCRLYSEHQTFNVDFFKNPFLVYKKEIDNLFSEKAFGKYCALALCVMFNNYLKEEWLTDDVNQDIKQIIENTCEACRLNKTTPRLVLKDELDSLIHTFLKKEQGCYRTIHDKVFDFLFFYFGNTPVITCIIKNGVKQLISERLLFKKTADSDQFTTIVPEKYQKMYIERVLADWSKGEVVIVFTNINMKSPEFRNTFLAYLKNLDITYQKQLVTKCDNAVYTAHEPLQTVIERDIYESIMEYYQSMKTPLLHCCAVGDINMVEWCCSYNADVNYCSNDGESPVYIACMGGYTDIVTKLVDNNADINKCTVRGESCLYRACMGGYADIVTKLVDNKADINKCTDRGESPVYIACMGGYTDIVTKLVDNNADINKCTGVGESSLYIACMGGYTDILTKLMDNNADINKCTDRGESPLYRACMGGYADIVTKLVDNKADINKCTDRGESPLYIACLGGYTNIVTKLVVSKADINKCKDRGESPLYIACAGGYTDIVTTLMDNKADINKCTEDGASPLYIACMGGYTGIMTTLVDNKADINKCTEYGESPLYTACAEGYTDIVTTLVDNKADINKCTEYGESPLYIACKGGYTEIVTKLVDNKADINKCNVFGTSPFYVACEGGYTDIVTKLLDNKADINKFSAWELSPLHIACIFGYTDIVNKLLDNKADIINCRTFGTPLQLACRGGYTDIVTKLVDNKADIDECTYDTASPLYIACERGYTDMVTKLVDSKADINKCSGLRATPLYIACSRGYTDIVTKLVDNKADINECTRFGESPLYIACKGGYTDIVSKLVDNKADINMCKEDGHTPLHIACQQGFIQIVKILIVRGGANHTNCDKNGHSSLDIARLCGHSDIVDFIRKYSV